jgi:predicted unusual protein kinase regulating ubiquinone biosynthesis (AarF/ABC1/UbiB family)
MDRGVLPSAFSEQFSQAQYKAPPLSGPLIVKTFREYFGKSPLDIFDQFDMQAAQAASIGQVHRAIKDGKQLAVKIQYPGVADSVISDLNLIRPIARQMFGWKDRDLEMYFEEVKDRLVEETDYRLELERSVMISARCAALPHIFFSTYYPDWSSERVITMDWLEGMHLDTFLQSDPSQEIRNQVGQVLWDFYNFQVHQMQIMHADPHPGNFLFRQDGQVGILDFGCVKEISEAFYHNYFNMLQPEILADEKAFLENCIAAQMIMEDDSPEEVKTYTGIFKEALSILCKPFHSGRFDFGDKTYFDLIYEYGERMSKNPALRQSRVPRGHKDGIYMNRAYFGLFSILNQLGAVVDTKRYMPEFNTNHTH